MGIKRFRVQGSGFRVQWSENIEPQNIEYRMLNIEGKENFIIRNSLFEIRYSKSVLITSDQEPET
jgi:hypothetical protein